MYRPIPFSISTLIVPNRISRSPLWCSFPVVLVALALALFAPSRMARGEDGAVGDGTSTAEGTNALGSLTTGKADTANGYLALSGNTTGSDNTATGTYALFVNSTGSVNTATGH
jgi:hypothetical protein